MGIMLLKEKLPTVMKPAVAEPIKLELPYKTHNGDYLSYIYQMEQSSINSMLNAAMLEEIVKSVKSITNTLLEHSGKEQWVSASIIVKDVNNNLPIEISGMWNEIRANVYKFNTVAIFDVVDDEYIQIPIDPVFEMRLISIIRQKVLGYGIDKRMKKKFK